MVDTAQNPDFPDSSPTGVIARYPAFLKSFYGMEDAIEQDCLYLEHAAQGLEEKQANFICQPWGGQIIAR